MTETEGQRNESAATDPPAIDVKGLSKRYGDVLAVRDLSFQVGAGEVDATADLGQHLDEARKFGRQLGVQVTGGAAATRQTLSELPVGGLAEAYVVVGIDELAGE